MRSKRPSPVHSVVCRLHTQTQSIPEVHENVLPLTTVEISPLLVSLDVSYSEWKWFDGSTVQRNHSVLERVSRNGIGFLIRKWLQCLDYYLRMRSQHVCPAVVVITHFLPSAVRYQVLLPNSWASDRFLCANWFWSCVWSDSSRPELVSTIYSNGFITHDSLLPHSSS